MLISKFRVWDSVLKYYREDDVYLDMSGVPLVRANVKGKSVLTYTPGLVVERTTGVYDCNDNEIFEGDILLFSDEKYVVKYIVEAGMFVFDGGELPFEVGDIDSHFYEIIGNVNEGVLLK